MKLSSQKAEAGKNPMEWGEARGLGHGLGEGYLPAAIAHDRRVLSSARQARRGHLW